MLTLLHALRHDPLVMFFLCYGLFSFFKALFTFDEHEYYCGFKARKDEYKKWMRS